MKKILLLLLILVTGQGCICIYDRDFDGTEHKFPPGPLYKLFCGDTP